MDPLLYLKLLRRRWYVVLLVTAVALAAAFATLPEDSGTAAPAASAYTATHVLLQAPETTAPVNLELTALFATTGRVPQLAARTLGRPPADGPVIAAQQVQVTVDTTVSAMRITATDPDPQQAARIADAFAEGVQTFLRTSADEARASEAETLQGTLNRLSAQVQRLGQQIPSAGVRAPLLEAQLEAFQTRYQAAFERQQALQEAGAATSALTTLQAAVPIPVVANGSPVPTSRTGRLSLALVLGLLLGAALVLVVDRLDTRVRSREEVEDASGLPVLTEVPRLPREARGRQTVVSHEQPDGAVAESYRALRSAMLLVPARPLVPAGAAVPPVDLSAWSPPHVLLVTSASPSDGKTSTTVNLAATLAESGRSVIVLDADFRKPAANAYLGVPHSPGLSELLAGGMVGGLRAALRDTVVPGVRLVTSGSSLRHPAALLARLGDLVEEARGLADVVIVDSAPLLVANDATDIVPHVDAVLFVAYAGKSTRPQTERAMELLARLAVPVLGVVLQASRDVDASTEVGYYGEPRSARAPSADAALPAPHDEPAVNDPGPQVTSPPLPAPPLPAAERSGPPAPVPAPGAPEPFVVPTPPPTLEPALAPEQPDRTHGAMSFFPTADQESPR